MNSSTCKLCETSRGDLELSVYVWETWESPRADMYPNHAHCPPTTRLRSSGNRPRHTILFELTLCASDTFGARSTFHVIARVRGPLSLITQFGSLPDRNSTAERCTAAEGGKHIKTTRQQICSAFKNATRKPYKLGTNDCQSWGKYFKDSVKGLSGYEHAKVGGVKGFFRHTLRVGARKYSLPGNSLKLCDMKCQSTRKEANAHMREAQAREKDEQGRLKKEAEQQRIIAGKAKQQKAMRAAMRKHVYEGLQKDPLLAGEIKALAESPDLSEEAKVDTVFRKLVAAKIVGPEHKYLGGGERVAPTPFLDIKGRMASAPEPKSHQGDESGNLLMDEHDSDDVIGDEVLGGDEMDFLGDEAHKSRQTEAEAKEAEAMFKMELAEMLAERKHW